MKQATAADVLPFVLRAGRGASRELCEAIASVGVPFILTEDGTPTFGYVVEPCGRDLVITAAAGLSRQVDLTSLGLMLAEAQGAQFDAIRFQTRRRGLVRKARQHGYSVIGTRHDNGDVFIMRKAIR